MKTPIVVQALVYSLALATFQGIAQPAYYPLKIGNTWQFGDAQHQTRSLRDTLLPDANWYKVLRDTWYNLEEYQRQQGDSIFLPGLLLYDFSSSPGDTIATAPGGYVCVLLSTNVAVVLGRPLRQWVFGRSWGSFTGELVYVTDSLGVTSIMNLEPPSQKILTGAQIDGVTYGVVSSVETSIDRAIPERIALEQNYPNPFNPFTTIKYQLPTNSVVRLKLYDVLGREVATLVDEFQDAGFRSVQFDGQKFTSGVYFYQLEAGGFTNVKKLLLLK